jgi:hypothetical protein
VRILLWSPNYAPEPTGIPPLVTDAAEWLVQEGHHVEVVTAVPNYPERRIRPEYSRAFSRTEMHIGVVVHRSWLRARPERTFVDKALYELTISTCALPNAIRAACRADVIVCVVPTLLAATYAASLSRILSKRLVLWMQDLVLSAAQAVTLSAAATRATIPAVRRCGFTLACTTNSAVFTRGSEPYEIPRVVVRDWSGDELVEQIRRRVPSLRRVGNHG